MYNDNKLKENRDKDYGEKQCVNMTIRYGNMLLLPEEKTTKSLQNEIKAQRKAINLKDIVTVDVEHYRLPTSEEKKFFLHIRFRNNSGNTFIHLHSLEDLKKLQLEILMAKTIVDSEIISRQDL